jgi:HPt (histidine-containing phosphotransfer) domain-containing protein
MGIEFPFTAQWEIASAGSHHVPGRTKRSEEAAADSTGAINLAHLKRATFGDEVLAREVLGLFEAQSERLLTAITTAASAKARREAAHALKGAALGIGANAVASAAADLEAVAADETRFGGALAHLSALVAVTRLAIAGMRARR